MDRRKFIRDGSLFAFGFGAGSRVFPWESGERLLAAIPETAMKNTNWASVDQKAVAKASSYIIDPPWGYEPGNLIIEDLHRGWATDSETAGAWVEIRFPKPRPVQELWLVGRAHPYNLEGQDPYLVIYARRDTPGAPRKITCTLSGGDVQTAELRQTGFYQIVRLPKQELTDSVRVTVNEVWTEPGTKGVGLGKVRVFSEPHSPSFEITVYPNYDSQQGKVLQAATLLFVNPGEQIADGKIQILQGEALLATLSLQPIPSRSVYSQDLWIPAPFEGSTWEFRVTGLDTGLKLEQSLRVSAYRSYFDGGVFGYHCSNHNDLGWLDTQEKTADYRSEVLILPAMKLLKENPEFRYSMECTAYLMEFLDRHPEKHNELAEYIKEGRFTWGASYVQVQEVHVGPEKLVRQFYLGKRWLKKAFGVDSHWYMKTDPPSMTLQMPQILRKAGINYIVQGRMPYGYYRWRSPDGSEILTYAYHYIDHWRLLDFKTNHGWLAYAAARENYYASHKLPPLICYDYASDYLPPQPGLIPYVKEQNQAMKRFAESWNRHFAGQKERQIHPPQLMFVEPEGFLDKLSANPLNIETLNGDWPFSWAYYDEPSNREGLLAGREAHNRLLSAERILAGLGDWNSYPDKTLAEAWQANCWPDHGWGGNRGIATDAAYVASYEKSKKLADQLLERVGRHLTSAVPKGAEKQLPLVVMNPVSWKRSDAVRCTIDLPAGWDFVALRDDTGNPVPLQKISEPKGGRKVEVIFLAENVPSVGYRTYYIEPSDTPPPPAQLPNDVIENEYSRIEIDVGGLKSFFDKRLCREVLRTEKFFGGEILQFTAPGQAWEDPEIVTMDDFDRTANHPFSIEGPFRGPVRMTAVCTSQFKHFALRQHFSLYHGLDRVEIEIEIVNWNGQKNRELRVAFPINIEEARLSYEAPFGTVEMGKNELDFSLLPPDSYSTIFVPQVYGAVHPLRFREAINWIDASSSQYQGFGVLGASDSTVHLFMDETTNPVSYPVLQHVLLSTRKSLAWNPDYWFTQEGSHHYRMALFTHQGNWRSRHRDAIAFNYPLVAFVASPAEIAKSSSLPASREFLKLEPGNLILTAMKKAEDDERIVLRFYEAEGQGVRSRIKLSQPIQQAWRASLIEDDEEKLPVLNDGTIEIEVNPWEIVTVKMAL
jgi:alpha-mannosidase